MKFMYVDLRKSWNLWHRMPYSLENHSVLTHKCTILTIFCSCFAIFDTETHTFNEVDGNNSTGISYCIEENIRM